MASELPKLTKNYFLVYAPDLPNAQRAKHVPEHIVHNTPLIKNGIISKSHLLRPTPSSEATEVVCSFDVPLLAHW